MVIRIELLSEETGDYVRFASSAIPQHQQLVHRSCELLHPCLAMKEKAIKDKLLYFILHTTILQQEGNLTRLSRAPFSVHQPSAKT